MVITGNESKNYFYFGFSRRLQGTWDLSYAGLAKFQEAKERLCYWDLVRSHLFVRLSGILDLMTI